MENSCGKIDIKGQVNEIELIERLVDSQIEEAIDAKNKNVKICKSLGIIFGAGIIIIFI